MIDSLHFIRPLWLLVIPLVIGLWWRIRQRQNNQAPVSTVIVSHLREALTVDYGLRRKMVAVDYVALVISIITIAAAGPSWNKQPSPWFEETAPLVIAIEVSDSMRSNDVLPTRLDRARFKALDLLVARTGAPTALIAYAGSAHIVMPPSRDLAVIKPFLEGLDPAIMPESGARADTVLQLAGGVLGERATAGTLLFINDGFDAADIPAFAQFSTDPQSPSVVALVLGSDSGGVALRPDGSAVMDTSGDVLDTRVDTGVLSRLQKQTGINVIRSGPGDGDIRQVQRAVASNLLLTDDPDAHWKDQSWWFLWPAAALLLLWFRRGWTLQ